jgi:hypothetical protein
MMSALQGRRRVLREEHKDTLDSMINTGLVLQEMENPKGALKYCQQALRAYEKVLGKTHPETLIPSRTWQTHTTTWRTLQRQRRCTG